MRTIIYSAAILLFSVPFVNPVSAQSTDCSTVGVTSDEAPPPLANYEQPPIPAPGYQWTPGYWAWNNVDYYWVPGTWVEPPQPGVLWTPPYWAFVAGAYVFHRGYWAPHVGFYGGVNYGYGYGGNGFEGGYWDHGTYYYNRSVTNFGNVRIANVYNRTVVVNNNSRVSFNGGRGGINARPTAAEEALAREPHIPPTRAQTQHLRTASTHTDAFASANHGRPAVAATTRAGDFKGPGAVSAGEGAPMEHGGNAPRQTPAANGKPEAMHGETGRNGPLSKRLDRRGTPNATPAEPNAVGRPNARGGEPGHEPMTKREGAGAGGPTHEPVTRHEGAGTNGEPRHEPMSRREGVNGVRRANEPATPARATPGAERARPATPEERSKPTLRQPQERGNVLHEGRAMRAAGTMRGGAGAAHPHSGPGAGRPQRGRDQP